MTDESVERSVPNFRAERSREVGREDFIEALADLIDLGLLQEAARIHGDREVQNAKKYTTNEAFWRESLDGLTREGYHIRLEGFHITEWIPYSPGRYHTPEAAQAREEAKSMFSWTNNEYLPLGKANMMLGGIGSVRLGGRTIDGRQQFFLGASSSGISHQGVPLIVPESEYFKVVDIITRHGGCYANITGIVRIMPPDLSLISYGNNVPKYFVVAKSIELREPSPSNILLATASVMYSGSYYDHYEGHGDTFTLGGFPTKYRKGWTFCSFNPSDGTEAVISAAEWLRSYAVRYSSSGIEHDPILSDFDEHYQHFSNPIEFPISSIIGGHVDLDRLEIYKEHYGFQINFIRELNMGDTINMSGNFQGAILNIKSTLSDVRQSIGAIPNIDSSIKDELKKLVDQLEVELQKVPPEKGEEAEAVAESAKILVASINKEKPNKAMIRVSAEGLKQAANNLATIAPIILKIASQIADTIWRFGG